MVQSIAWWQASGAGQVRRLIPWQTPATQVSTFVQASPSSQGVPSGTGGKVQPVLGLQVPDGSSQTLVVFLHTFGVEPIQTPPWHLSTVVQGLPSSQSEVSGTRKFEQRPVAVTQRGGW